MRSNRLHRSKKRAAPLLPCRGARIESLEPRQLLAVPTLPPIADLTVANNNPLYGGAPMHIALDGYDADGDTLTYTVSITNSTVSLTPQISPDSNPSLRISVQSDQGGTPATTIQGDMVFELFQDLTPRTVDRITTLASQGFYNGLTFHRVIKDFMIQGGDPTGTGSGGSGVEFDDEFHPFLQFTSPGMLGMARSDRDDTNDSQFFITAAPTRWLDFSLPIFGYLTDGDDIREQIENVATHNGVRPIHDVVMSRVEVFQDNQRRVLRLSAPEGASGEADVTVTASDGHGGTASQHFHVSVRSDTSNSPPFLGALPAEIETTAGAAPFTYQIPATDLEGDPIFYSVSPSNLVTVNSSTGQPTITPPAVPGMYDLTFEVRRLLVQPDPWIQPNPWESDLQVVRLHVMPRVNDPPIAHSLTLAVPQNGSISIALRGDDGDPEVAQTLTFATCRQPDHGRIESFDPHTGQLVYVPATGYRGTDFFCFTVTDDDTAGGPAKTSAPARISITVLALPAAPTVRLLQESDSGRSRSDRITNFNNTEGKSLSFRVSGIVPGADVGLFADGVLVGYGHSESGSAMTITTITPSTNPGGGWPIFTPFGLVDSSPLDDGAHSITAVQAVWSEPIGFSDDGIIIGISYWLQSPPSTPLPITIDSSPPRFVSSPVTQSTTGRPYVYDVQTDEETAGGIIYRLAAAPAGMRINPTTGRITWTPSPRQTPSQSVTVRAEDRAGNTADQSFVIDVSVLYTASRILAVGAEAGSASQPLVKVIDASTGTVLASFLAYEPAYRGGVRGAVGDLDGDGQAEVVTAPGRSHAPQVKVFDVLGHELPQYRFSAYAAGFVNGVQLAVADVTGDGRNDIVTVPSRGPAEVRVFENRAGAHPGDPFDDVPWRKFLAFPSTFLGGATVAAADMNGDARAEVIVGSGPGMRATVRTFDLSVLAGGGAPLKQFYPLTSTFRGGISIAVGRVNADATPEILVAAGSGGTSTVQVLDGRSGTALASFHADTGSSWNATVRAVGKDLDGDGIIDQILTAQGTDGRTREIRRYRTSGQYVDRVLAVEAALAGGLFLG